LKAIEIEHDILDVKIASYVYIVELFFFGFNGIRQGFALGVTFLAIVLYVNGKIIRPLILLMVAFLFHKSAVVCLTVILAREIFKSKYRNHFLFASIIVAVYLINNRHLLGMIAGKIGGSDYYTGYFTRDAEVDSSLWKYYLKNSPILVLGISIFSKLKANKKAYLYFVLMIVGIIISSLGSITGTMASRIGIYFSMFDIIVMGYVAKQNIHLSISGIHNKRLINQILIYGYFGFVFYYETFYKGFSNLVPYGLPI